MIIILFFIYLLLSGVGFAFCAQISLLQNADFWLKIREFIGVVIGVVIGVGVLHNKKATPG